MSIGEARRITVVLLLCRMEMLMAGDRGTAVVLPASWRSRLSAGRRIPAD